MPSSSSNHRNKRPFQPHITSFFDIDEATTTTTTTTGTVSSARYLSTGPAAARTPALPAAVQASLLSVGMRVRKAVPEGYKTHKTALFDDAATPSFARPAELVPFCGIHRVGGLGIQHQQSGEALDMDGDWFGGSSSQESNASTVSMDSQPKGGPAGYGFRRNGNKRPFEEDVSDDDEEGEDDDERMDGASRGIPQAFAMQRDANRRRRWRRGGGAVGFGHGPPQGLQVVNGDFEEAGFLRPWNEVDMGRDGRTQ